MKAILSIVLAFSLLASCAAYRRRPIATVASVTTLAVAPVGVTVALGYAGGGTADTWQGEFARYGGGQLSVIAIIIASGVFAWADDWKRSE